MSKKNDVKITIRGEFEIEINDKVILKEFMINYIDYKIGLKELSKSIEEILKVI